MKNFRRLIKYIEHFLTARHSGGFGVHSPFVFDFVEQVLREKHPFYIFENIENIRKILLKDHRQIDIEDFGTGSNRRREVKEIAAHTLKSPRLAQLIFRMIHHYHCRSILELGTSLGISTIYLASGDKNIQCLTLEGCKATAAIARENFKKSGLKNIELVTTNIDESLEEILAERPHRDFIFIDANHRYEATVRNFETCLNFCTDNSIIVLDDIYWSAGMEKAWKQIKQHDRVKSTVDIYHMGIVFLNPVLNKQHYKIRF